MVLKRVVLFLLTAALLLPILPVTAAETAASGDMTTATEATFPSVSELGSRYAQLTNYVEKSNGRLKELADLQAMDEALREWEVKIKESRQKVSDLGNLEDWYVDRLTHYKVQFDAAARKLEDLQNLLAVRLGDVQRISDRHRAEKEFWTLWIEELKKQESKTPETTFKQVNAQLATLNANILTTSASLIPLQERVSMLERGVIEERDRFSTVLDRLRKATFRKNDFSFFSADFYGQFTPGLWAEMKSGFHTTLTVAQETLKNNSWAYLLFLLLMLVLALGIYRYRSAFASSEEWQFVLSNPWSAGGFVAAVVAISVLPTPSPVFAFTLTLIAVVGATKLTISLIQNRQQALVLATAATVMVMSNGLRLVSFPLPYFRIYIAVLSLVAIPLLVGQILLSKQKQAVPSRSFFRQLLSFFVVVFLLSLAGQVAGYVNFSIWLFRAVFETGMIVLFVIMGLRLGDGFINFLLGLERLRKNTFFKKFRNELETKLEGLFKIVVYVYALFNLMPVWRIFNSAAEAWSSLATASVSIGEVELTLQMAILASIALYFAAQISWLLQAMCETQVFYRKSVDRGVLDAIKKLIHYGVILVGLLVALSMLGMNLQHFIVVLGALGVGIGFGLQDIVNNFLSGIILLFERPIKVGDGILVDNEYGTVKYIGLRSTIVETLDQSELIVPNSQMISQKVTNWTLSTRRVRIVIPVGVAYGSPVQKVLSILSEVSSQHPDVLDTPAPSPIFIAFGDSSLDFELRVWIANVDGRPRIKSELLGQIDTRFREEGIEIPFPQRDLHLRSIDMAAMAAFQKKDA